MTNNSGEIDKSSGMNELSAREPPGRSQGNIVQGAQRLDQSGIKSIARNVGLMIAKDDRQSSQRTLRYNFLSCRVICNGLGAVL